MAKKETLVRTLTSEAEATYGSQAIGFYDNPRTFTPKGKKDEITENRLYISIDNIGKKQVVKRKVTDEELPLLKRRYERAYNLYLAAKKSGGRLDETSQLVDSLAAKNKEIAKKEKESASKDEEIENMRKEMVLLQEAAKKTKETKSE